MAMTMLHPFTKNCASALFRHWNVSVRLWFAGSGSPRATFPAEERTMVTATAFLYLDCCFFESGTPRLPMGVSARPTICQNIAPPWPCLSMWDTPFPLVNFLSQSRAWGQWLRSPAPLSSALVRRKVTSLLATSQRGCHFFSVLSFSTSMPRCFSLDAVGIDVFVRHPQLPVGGGTSLAALHRFLRGRLRSPDNGPVRHG
mmetsp:Transcript_27282/g.42134  ORF Transcript_27282/g.42134 Transcript_27282/m.42134 type:complete len:200 (-) Transcript_27282:75-674(-)